MEKKIFKFILDVVEICRSFCKDNKFNLIKGSPIIGGMFRAMIFVRWAWIMVGGKCWKGCCERGDLLWALVVETRQKRSNIYLC